MRYRVVAIDKFHVHRIILLDIANYSACIRYCKNCQWTFTEGNRSYILEIVLVH